MRIVIGQKAVGGMNFRRRFGGAIPPYDEPKKRRFRKSENRRFFTKKTNVSHPFKSLGKTNLKSLEGGRIKSTKPKKYISLNL
jgi:hypothetical protein